MYAGIVLILAFVLLILSIVLYLEKGRVTRWSLFPFASFLLLVIWVSVANLMASASECASVSSVSYHPVLKKTLSDGTKIDLAFVKDDNGIVHVVNLNESLGISVPDDGGDYQVARVDRDFSFLGIKFRGSRKYEIIKKLD